MQTGRTAILYFAYRPDVEAVRKPIFSDHGAKVNAHFYHSLQEELFGRLTPLGVPLIHIDDQQQRGEGFGERFCNAVEDVLAKGYDRLMILGNDAPEIKTEKYQHIIEALDNGESCLIPTESGGTGVIAIQAKDYDRQKWMDVSWQSNAVYFQLYDAIEGCTAMDPVHELNDLSDVFAYLEVHRGKDVIAFLIESILNPLQNYVPLMATEKERQVIRRRNLRGPPFTC